MATATTLKLRIVTPESVLLEEQVKSVRFPGEDGSFGILPRHASMLSLSESGLLVAKRESGETLEYIIHDGFVEVRNNVVTVLTRAGERPDEIDLERAKQAAGRAKDRLRGAKVDVDMIRAQAALRRALMRERLARRS